MHSMWFRSTFLGHFKFLKIKERVPNLWFEPIVQIVWIVWSALLYFNFENFKNQSSSPFIRYQCILLESGVRFSCFSICFKLKRGDLISSGGGGGPILQIVWSIWSPLLYHNWETSKDLSSSSFNRFQCVLSDLKELLSHT